MEWARTINGNRTRAVPGAVAYCPSCGMEVSAKCGEINSWHWAHHGGDCDPWSEGETPWHINWKQLFPEDWREVVIPPHRADVKTPNIVIELQHSPINPEMIREREQFYGNMVWLYDLQAVRENIHLHEPDQSAHRPFVPFSLKLFAWRHARRSWFTCTKPVLVHLARGELYNVFGFGFYSGLNFAGGFARRFDKDQFLSAVGAAAPQSGDEPNELYPFDQMPSAEVARNWQPYWHDERTTHQTKPLFTIRRFEQQPGKPIRILRLPGSNGL